MIPIDKVSFNYHPVGHTTHLRATLLMGRILRIDPGWEPDPDRRSKIEQYLRSEIWADVYGELEPLIQELGTIALRSANEGGELARVQELKDQLQKLLEMPASPT